MNYIISYDLGTGGTKASLFNENGKSIVSAFVPCNTFFPKNGFHEQRPEDWWNSVVVATKEMLLKANVNVEDIVSLAVSGHSLGVVPIGYDGKLLSEYVPIWSDARAGEQALKFFESVEEEQWYLTTGNGFPAGLYSIFKLMWYKDHCIDMYEKTDKFIGTKDYINYCMTGVLCTDHSYASGSGVYSLLEQKYLNRYIKAAGIDPNKLPSIHASTYVMGTVKPDVAELLGLSPNTKVVCGGVDNACMAVGAGCVCEGEAYTSLGSSAWIAVSSEKPVVNNEKRPYVFAHCIPNMFVSATSIFSAGNSFRWLRNNICKNFMEAEQRGEGDSYDLMVQMAQTSPIGAKHLIFNPSLAGGSGLDKSDNVRGGFIGLDLGHTQADLIRATLEGVCFNLKLAMNVLEEYVALSNDMLIVGGGGKSRFWRKLFADIYYKNIIETNIGQDAGSLGAAVVAAVGAGIWKDFSKVKDIHKISDCIQPDFKDAEAYAKIIPVFEKIADIQSDIGDMMAQLN